MSKTVLTVSLIWILLFIRPLGWVRVVFELTFVINCSSSCPGALAVTKLIHKFKSEIPSLYIGILSFIRLIIRKGLFLNFVSNRPLFCLFSATFRPSMDVQSKQKQIHHSVPQLCGLIELVYPRYTGSESYPGLFWGRIC